MVADTKQFIKGYRALTPAEVAMINEIKDLGEFVNEKLKNLKRLEYVDPRWLQIAETELQKSFMYLVRAIAKPENF